MIVQKENDTGRLAGSWTGEGKAGGSEIPKPQFLRWTVRLGALRQYQVGDQLRARASTQTRASPLAPSDASEIASTGASAF